MLDREMLQYILDHWESVQQRLNTALNVWQLQGSDESDEGSDSDFEPWTTSESECDSESDSESEGES